MLRSIQCPHCLKAFETRDRRTVYCSMVCRRSAERVRMEKTCVACGKLFLKSRGNRNPKARSKRDFCSRKCGGMTGPGKQEYACERCGKTFTAYRVNGGKPRRFCSVACHFPKPNVARPCARCGAVFVRKKRGQREDRFCSRGCYVSFSGESAPEARVRSALNALGVVFIPQHRVGRYSIDFFIPSRRVALEVDGTYWHTRRPEHDANRDATLLAKHAITTVRITDAAVARSRRVERLVAKTLGIKDSQLALWQD